MGNPLGMGAARLLVSLLHQLTQNPKVQFGAAAAGAGLGVGTAVILENLSKHDENQLYT
jgi:3-oxoadipyl-CoA thiolase